MLKNFKIYYHRIVIYSNKKQLLNIFVFNLWNIRIIKIYEIINLWIIARIDIWLEVKNEIIYNNIFCCFSFIRLLNEKFIHRLRCTICGTHSIRKIISIFLFNYFLVKNKNISILKIIKDNFFLPCYSNNSKLSDIMHIII